MTEAEKMFEYTIHTFKKINPDKKFSQFTCYDIDSLEECKLYMENGMVVRLSSKHVSHNEYFQYSGSRSAYCSGPHTSIIEFTNRNKIIYPHLVY